MPGAAQTAVAKCEAKKCQLVKILTDPSANPISAGLQDDSTVLKEINELINEYKNVLPLLKNDPDSTRWLATGIAEIMMNYTHDEYYQPLHMAISQSPTDIIRFMLENGIDPNNYGGLNVSPLRLALDQDRMDVVRLLLASGASPVGDEDATMLHHAVQKQNVELIGLLLDKGADINEPDIFGRTPIHDAVTQNRMMLCRFLIENGADINTVSRNHESLLQIAIHYKAYDVARLLLKQNIDVNVVDNKGYSPIYFALNYRELDIARDIINKNLNLDQVGPNGVPLLHTVATYGYADILQLLLEKGVDIDQKHQGKTALDAADHYKHPEAKKVLEEWKQQHK
jgi:uncharacterized protein